MITIAGDVTLTVDSDLNGPSPQFTLTCVSTGGPATTVTWTRGSGTAVEFRRSLVVDGVTAQYTHTLTVIGRLPGVYTCNVANEISPQDSESFTVESIIIILALVLFFIPFFPPVASAPTNVMAVQEGLTSIRVSWTPSSDATGYIISYTGGGSGSVNVGSTGNYPLTGLVMGASYTISIVATSQHFSSRAVELRVTLGEALLIWHCLLSLYIVPAPGQPSVTVTSITATSISLSWSVSSGSVVTSSEVMWREASSGTSEGTSGSLTGTSYTIDQLESTTIYTITVTVSNTVGTDSQPVIISTSTTPTILFLNHIMVPCFGLFHRAHNYTAPYASIYYAQIIFLPLTAHTDSDGSEAANQIESSDCTCSDTPAIIGGYCIDCEYHYCTDGNSDSAGQKSQRRLLH